MNNVDNVRVQTPEQMDQAVRQTGFSYQGIGAQPRATLILVSKRQIPNMFRRPHQYRFDGEFRKDLDESIHRAMTRPFNNLDTFMLGSAAARAAVMPSATAEEMDLRPLSDQWTFILIVDLDAGHDPLGRPSPIPSRIFYSGWVMDEPVTNANLGGVVLNESAVLSTTHYTRLTLQQTLGYRGTYNQVQTCADFDYVNPGVVQGNQMDGSQLFDIRPGTIANGITFDPMDSSTVSIGSAAAPLTGSNAPYGNNTLAIPSEMNAPTYHLGRVVSGIVDGVKQDMYSRSNDLSIIGESPQESLINNIATMLRTENNVQIDGVFDPGTPFTLGEVIRKFGNTLHVLTLDQPTQLQYEVGDAGAMSRRNVFSSIISTSLPNMLAEFGIADVAFRYNSAAREPGTEALLNAASGGGVFQLLNLGMLYTATPQDQTRAWDLLTQRLRYTVFPIIKTNGGDFDLMVHCSLTGVSLINLQLLDMMQEPGLIETNNLLGGLNSPLIGTYANYQNNAQQLAETASVYQYTQQMSDLAFPSQLDLDSQYSDLF